MEIRSKNPTYFPTAGRLWRLPIPGEADVEDSDSEKQLLSELAVCWAEEPGLLPCMHYIKQGFPLSATLDIL